MVISDHFSIRQCDFYKVIQKLEDSGLKSHLLELQSSDEYLYINAFVNTMKHRNLVKFGSKISFIDDEAGVYFEKFEYNGSSFESLWAEQVLEKTISVKNSLIKAGVLLNENIGVKSM